MIMSEQVEKNKKKKRKERIIMHLSWLMLAID